MSLPNIPDINPLITLNREEVYHLLLASIAMEEISMSHILNAEGEKIQKLLQSDELCVENMAQMSRGVERIMRNVMKNQMLLLCKLEDVLSIQPSCELFCEPEHDEE